MSPQPACPICAKPRSATHRPFCSPRCADVDLQRWLVGSYVLPDESDEETSEPSDAGEVAGQEDRRPL